MNGAQIAMIVLMAMGIGIALAKDGQPSQAKHSVVQTLVAQTILAAILYWGGFWGGA